LPEVYHSEHFAAENFTPVGIFTHRKATKLPKNESSAALPKRLGSQPIAVMSAEPRRGALPFGGHIQDRHPFQADDSHIAT